MSGLPRQLQRNDLHERSKAQPGLVQSVSVAMKKPSLQVDANGSLSAAWSLPADTKPSKRKGERITGDSRKTVVITGVSRGGIGEACALHFAQKGFHVYGR